MAQWRSENSGADIYARMNLEEKTQQRLSVSIITAELNALMNRMVRLKSSLALSRRNSTQQGESVPTVLVEPCSSKLQVPSSNKLKVQHVPSHAYMHTDNRSAIQSTEHMHILASTARRCCPILFSTPQDHRSDANWAVEVNHMIEYASIHNTVLSGNTKSLRVIKNPP